MDSGSIHYEMSEAEKEIQELLRERRRLSVERQRLRQLIKNEKRKKERILRKAAQLSRQELLELATHASC